MIEFNDNMPNGVTFVLFSVNEEETDKLHIMQEGASSAGLAFLAMGINNLIPRTFLYFSMPSRKFTSMGTLEQCRISKNTKPLDILKMTPGQIWKLTLDKVYAACASAVMEMSLSHYEPEQRQKQEMYIYQRMRKMAFDPFAAFGVYANGIRSLQRSPDRKISTALNMTNRLAVAQMSLSGHFYGFSDVLQTTGKSWPAISTVVSAPEDERFSLYKAGVIGKLNIGIAAVLVDDSWWAK